ncbi:ATP-binding protein [Planomonospora sp. ID91781]|uniref:ATPase n=1 Tax=Planomonospora sphaerica TaxID=161355 RepID=A0A171CA17_9ACTN|nr:MULTISPECIES: ATP-binding protein [Planomonospora]MBG0820626.1 ATP-binding protein [Planomonospora sp. ID91781]GAT66364.1 ATPase [Planomonospora sphaerica]
MIRKPDRVFNRDGEWAELAAFAESTSPHVRLGVISGRRRQGKTYLLEALAEATGGFYFTAQEATSSDSLREFGAALADHSGGRAPYALGSWDDALRALYETVPRGLVVIDEFPYLIRAHGPIPSLVQRALDPRGWAHQGSETRLLLCGSAMSVMGKLLAGNAPLRGRAALELVVRPFDYRTAARFWGIDDPRLAVLVHAVVGGTPAYRHAFVREDVPAGLADFDDWIIRTVLNPSVPLFREARYLLAEETDIREPALYNSVLGAIAAGNTTRGGIAGHIGRKATEILHPLNVLEDAGLITRQSDPFHGRRSSFRIAEPLIAFYEAVMRREWTRLERGNRVAAWGNSQATFLAQVVGPHFEWLCREWAMDAGPEVFGELPGEVAEGVVADPVNRTQIQVDVAVLSSALPGERRRILSLGEAKWDKPMGMRHLDRLRRARDLLSVKGYDTSATILACYGGAEFDADLRAAAADPRILLVDLATLYG